MVRFRLCGKVRYRPRQVVSGAGRLTATVGAAATFWTFPSPRGKGGADGHGHWQEGRLQAHPHPALPGHWLPDHTPARRLRLRGGGRRVGLDRGGGRAAEFVRLFRTIPTDRTSSSTTSRHRERPPLQRLRAAGSTIATRIARDRREAARRATSSLGYPGSG